jgi:transcription elongation factor GreA
VSGFFFFSSLKKEVLITTNQNRNIIMAYMSQEGYDKLRAQIKHLEEVERPEVIRQIAEAREKGDLSENAEYDAAKEAQGKLETKIAELKAVLADTKILDPSKLTKKDEVQILSKVDLKNVDNGMKLSYTIVSEGEANLRENKISIKTPIAQGLLGKKVGDVAEVTVPRGVMKFEIMNISFG